MVKTKHMVTFQFLPHFSLSYSEVTFSNLGNDSASPMFRSFSQEVSLNTLWRPISH